MLPILTACVGVSTITRTEKGFEHGVSLGIGDQVGEYPPVGDHSREDRGITKSDVLMLWGNPKRQFNENGREYWTYDYDVAWRDRKSTRLNSSHGYISYAVFCLKKK